MVVDAGWLGDERLDTRRAVGVLGGDGYDGQGRGPVSERRERLDGENTMQLRALGRLWT